MTKERKKAIIATATAVGVGTVFTVGALVLYNKYLSSLIDITAKNMDEITQAVIQTINK